MRCNECEAAIPNGSVFTTIYCPWSGGQYPLDHECSATPESLRYWASRHRRMADALDAAAEQLEREREEVPS